MTSADIRGRFLRFFQERGHAVRPSSSLVPGDDPTLLFTNAGMVQFKRVFLGAEESPFRRAVTSQKCVRAGGKHNDLEQVGETTRHHTFFEMLGNFSFGDYFKREAVGYAWEFLTGELGLDPERLFATVHHTDDEAARLWEEVAGVPQKRIFRLGDEDNFWQMADTGPCGPCSELHYDLRPEEERGSGRPVPLEEFVQRGERGEFLELWNLVFMQFDRDEAGTLHPLPAPSIDTGAGLERLTAVLQGADSNYHTDLFLPLLDRVARVVGRPYRSAAREGVSYRVLADHSRAVAFLMADGIFPSNEGRGYVLRRILRRAVRHAWLLGRREPTLEPVVDQVVEEMGGIYPELVERRATLLRTTRMEEERFLATIEGGMERFEALAPPLEEGGPGAAAVIEGGEAFRLYDTFGFPLDLTELMARERGYRVDVDGFNRALEEQRARSRADRAAADPRLGAEEVAAAWVHLEEAPPTFTGYDSTEERTEVLAFARAGDRLLLQLRATPFYAEGGGQVSDRGVVEGEGWRLEVDEVRRSQGRLLVAGRLPEGFPEAPMAPLRVAARVDAGLRQDTQRNHTATHLLHAALREVLGEHVAQRGSLVAPDRLRFDFSHPAPVTARELAEVEERVNQAIWADLPVLWEDLPYDEAVSRGAMALFGEKYGDRVRMVEVPGVSMELCGGTHLRHTGAAGPFRITWEGGVASGIRRVEALTGPGAFRHLREQEARLDEASRILRTPREHLLRRAEQLLAEKGELERLLEELRKGGGAGEEVVAEGPLEGEGAGGAIYRAVRLRARDADDVRSFGDAFLASGTSGVVVVAAGFPDERHSLFTFVTDDLIRRGVRADRVVRGVAELVGGKGGGRPHMAQAGVERVDGLDAALREGHGLVQRMVTGEEG